MADSLSFTVPLTPPGFNHYVKHTRTGRHYVTSDARMFKEAVALCIAGRSVCAKSFHVDLTIYLAAGQKGDVDGFPKLVLDGLAKAMAFRDRKGKPMSDAHVTDLVVRKRRDTAWPRTDITIRGCE
jgi:crossover junction endodeoxyribonuclease RusA